MLFLFEQCAYNEGTNVKLPEDNTELSKHVAVYRVSQGVKVTTSGFNSRADSESKSHIHMGPIRNGSRVMIF